MTPSPRTATPGPASTRRRRRALAPAAAPVVEALERRRLLSGGTFTPGQTLTLSAVADAHVRGGGHAWENYGEEERLEVKESNHDNYDRVSYLAFEMPVDLLPCHIGEVRLRLYGSLNDDGDGSLPYAARGAGDGWDEATVTYATRPDDRGRVQSVVDVRDEVPRWYEWDVTGFVAAETGRRLHGTVTLSLQSTRTSSTYASFESSETLAQARPTLVLETVACGRRGERRRRRRRRGRSRRGARPTTRTRRWTCSGRRATSPRTAATTPSRRGTTSAFPTVRGAGRWPARRGHRGRGLPPAARPARSGCRGGSTRTPSPRRRRSRRARGRATRGGRSPAAGRSCSPLRTSAPTAAATAGATAAATRPTAATNTAASTAAAGSSTSSRSSSPGRTPTRTARATR